MNRNEEHESHHVRRIQLPSGKTIEVVYFSDQAVDGNDLHVCRQCSSELVYPTGWEEVGSRTWQVTLRCPSCEELREGVFTQDAVDAFDERLDEGTSALAADLRRLTQANMVDELERFIAALAVDAILPEDF